MSAKDTWSTGSAPSATLPTYEKDPAMDKAVDKMRLSDLLKLSGALGAVRRFDLGAILSALGVGLLGAAVGTGDNLGSGDPLYMLIGGAIALLIGLVLTTDRTLQIGRIKSELDFEIDAWCRRDSEAQELRDRYATAMKPKRLWQR